MESEGITVFIIYPQMGMNACAQRRHEALQTFQFRPQVPVNVGDLSLLYRNERLEVAARDICGTCCTVVCTQGRTTCPSLPFEYQMLLIAPDLPQLCWIASEASRVEGTTPRRTFPTEAPSASVSHNENVTPHPHGFRYSAPTSSL